MSSTTLTPKPKKKFKLPHLFWIMMGLLLVTSLLTYIIPAGQFATDPTTKQIIGTKFNYLGHQTPVDPITALMLILDGLVSSSNIGWAVLLSGAMIMIIMGTGALDEFLNWAIYKLKDKNESILISGMFILMVYLGAFGGTDALIAVVPIGVMFCRKMKLDPICAIGVSTYATLLGFGTGPTKQMITQMLMGTRIYGSFFTMFISMNVFMVLGLFLLLRYVKKIRKDPSKSLMFDEGWVPGAGNTVEDEAALANVTKLSWRTILILTIYMGQFVFLVAYPMITGNNAIMLQLMGAVSIIVSIACGFIGKFSFDKLGDEFAKGLSMMAFIAFVIGIAKVMSMIMINGNILHTIVYTLTLPLMSLPLAVSSVGMTGVISVVNVIIPSASSKAAILVPILKPISDVLKLNPDISVLAFQYGDGFTNMISPFLAWTVGSCVMAGVPFPKWIKWVFPKVLIFIATAFVIVYLLTAIGWTAF